MKKNLLCIVAMLLVFGSLAVNAKTQVKVGLTSWATSVYYDDFVITDPDGKVLFQDNFSGQGLSWTGNSAWKREDGHLVRKDVNASMPMTFCNVALGDDFDVRLKARKLDGKEGFIIVIDYDNGNKQTLVNLGGFDNEQFLLQHFKGSRQTKEYVTKGSVSSSCYYDGKRDPQVYDIHLKVRKGKVYSCFLDDVPAILTEKAFKEFEERVKSSGTSLYYAYAEAVYNFRGSTQPRNIAIDYYKKALDAGDNRAYIDYAVVARKDLHAKAKDIEKYRVKAAELGSIWAYWNLAYEFYEDHMYADAAKYFAMAAEQPFEWQRVCDYILRHKPISYRTNLGYTYTDFTEKYPDAHYAYEYARYRLGLEENYPPLEQSVPQNSAFALKKLVELADQGVYNTLTRSFRYLWTGEMSNLPKNRQKAVELLDKNPNEKQVNILRAIAKGAGLYEGNISLETYKRAWNEADYNVRSLIDSEIQAGNPEAAACKFFNDRDPLTKMLDAGNKRAAELVVQLLEGHGGEGNEQLLAKAGVKTGHDKGADDIQKLNAVYAEIDSLARGLKTGEMPFMNYYLQLYKFYEKHPESDKHGYLEKAKPLQNFITISEAMNVRDYQPDNFWYYKIENSGPFGMIKTDYGPKWVSRDEDFRKIDEAIALCKTKLTDKKYGKLFQRYKLRLEQKQKVLKENLRKGEASYEKALAEYRAEQAKKSGYSGSSSSSRSSNSSSTNSSSNSTKSGDSYSCKVHLHFSDGDKVYKGHIIVYFKGLLSPKKEFYTDTKGNATITWSDSQGNEIEAITLNANVGFNDRYTKEGLSLKNGGDYTICMDCK